MTNNTKKNQNFVLNFMSRLKVSSIILLIFGLFLFIMNPLYFLVITPIIVIQRDRIKKIVQDRNNRYFCIAILAGVPAIIALLNGFSMFMTILYFAFFMYTSTCKIIQYKDDAENDNEDSEDEDMEDSNNADNFYQTSPHDSNTIILDRNKVEVRDID